MEIIIRSASSKYRNKIERDLEELEAVRRRVIEMGDAGIKDPLTPAIAVKIWGHGMSTYEKGEVVDYPNVWYCSDSSVSKSGRGRSVPFSRRARLRKTRRQSALQIMDLMMRLAIMLLFMEIISRIGMRFWGFLGKEALVRFASVWITRLGKLSLLKLFEISNDFILRLLLKSIFFRSCVNGYGLLISN